MTASASSARRHTVRIGLTGPIGCGKSTVAEWLAELGAVVIDADVVAREVTSPGRAAYDAVAAEFGLQAIAPDRSLDRAALARIVFSDADALARLEAIIHPAVRPQILRRITVAERRDAPAVVVEAIKLVEGGLAALCDEVWLIACDPEQQRTRLAERGTTQKEAEARIAAQSELVARLQPHASRVIDTNGSAADTRRAVRRAYAAARARAGRG